MRTHALVAALLALTLAALAGPASAQSAPGLQVGASAQAQASADAPSVDAPSVDAPGADVASLAQAADGAPPASLDDVIALSSVGLDAEAQMQIEASSTTRAPGATDGITAVAEALANAVGPEVAASAPPVLAGAGFLALLQAFGVWRIMGLGAFAMYSRLSRSELLDNEHRDKVYQLIRATPGLGVSEIAERTGFGWGTTVYHLDRLERAKFVTSERSGLHRCYYPVGEVAKDDRKVIGALKSDTTRSIAELLVARPGVTQSELCDALGMSASAASKQITKLEKSGLVRREREWKTARLYAQGPLNDAMAFTLSPHAVTTTA